MKLQIKAGLAWNRFLHGHAELLGIECLDANIPQDCIVELDDYYSMYYNYFEPVITNKDNFLIGKISIHEGVLFIRLKWRKYLSSSKYRIQRVDTEDNVWKTICWNEEDNRNYDDMKVRIGEKYQYRVIYYENQNIIFKSNSILIHLIQIPEHFSIDDED